MKHLLMRFAGGTAAAAAVVALSAAGASASSGGSWNGDHGMGGSYSKPTSYQQSDSKQNDNTYGDQSYGDKAGGGKSDSKSYTPTYTPTKTDYKTDDSTPVYTPPKNNDQMSYQATDKSYGNGATMSYNAPSYSKPNTEQPVYQQPVKTDRDDYTSQSNDKPMAYQQPTVKVAYDDNNKSYGQNKGRDDSAMNRYNNNKPYGGGMGYGDNRDKVASYPTSDRNDNRGDSYVASYKVNDRGDNQCLYRGANGYQTDSYRMNSWSNNGYNHCNQQPVYVASSTAYQAPVRYETYRPVYIASYTANTSNRDSNCDHQGNYGSSYGSYGSNRGTMTYGRTMSYNSGNNRDRDDRSNDRRHTNGQMMNYRLTSYRTAGTCDRSSCRTTYHPATKRC